LRDFVILSLLRIRKSRTLHTLTGGPKSGVHFRLDPGTAMTTEGAAEAATPNSSVMRRDGEK
jgi:hypothetical protein